MNSITSFFAGIMAFVSSLFGYHNQLPAQPATQAPTPIVEALTTQASTTETINNPIKNYNLFTIQEWEKNYNWSSEESIWYKEDGIVETGEYKGWHRIIGFKENYDGMNGGAKDFGNISYFITQDYTKYLVDSPSVYDSLYNKDHVIGTTTVPTTFPETLPLANFILVRKNIINEKRFLDAKLTALAPLLKEYSVKSSPPLFQNEDELYEKHESFQSAEKYLSSNTTMLIQDNYGLVARYTLIPKTVFETYIANNKNIPFEDLNFSTSLTTVKDITLADTQKNIQFFTKYENFIQGGCTSGGLITSSLTEKDLVKIGTLHDGTSIFGLRENNHPLQQTILSLKSKRKNFTEDQQKTYLTKHSVIAIQEPWGGYLLLAESENSIIGSCAK